MAITEHAKKLPNPGTASFGTLAVAQKDPLILAKSHFYMAIFSNVLTTYQPDEPVIQFLARDLAKLTKVMIILVFDAAILLQVLLSSLACLKI